MKLSENNIAVIVYSTLSFLLLAGYFAWAIFFKTTAEPPPAATAPAQTNFPAPTSVSKPTEPEKITAAEKPLPVKKPSASTSINPFFEEINKAAKNLETKLKNEIAAPAPVAPAAPIISSAPNTFSVPTSTLSLPSGTILKSTPTELVFSLTDKDFHAFYPDDFIAGLVEAQNLFVKSSDPTYEPLTKIETDDQVRAVEEKIVSALLATNMITNDEAKRYTATIRLTLPQLQLFELKNVKPSASIRSVLNRLSLNQPFISYPRPLPKKMLFAGLLEKVRNAFIPKAQAVPCGYCYTLPECFQVGAFSPLPSPNLWFPFCYCTGCYTASGCLSFNTGRQAIQDPMTGICGAN